MTGPVYINRTGDHVSSPNSNEQLCEAVEHLAALVKSRDELIGRLMAERRVAPKGTDQ